MRDDGYVPREGGGQCSIKRRSKNPLATALVVGGLVVSSRRSIC